MSRFGVHWRLDVDGKTPVPCDMQEWVAWMAMNEAAGIDYRRVALTRRWGRTVVVSTVFLTIDHAWDDGPPVLWETMVFGGPHHEHQERYTSWDDAIAGHKRIVHMVRWGNDDVKDDGVRTIASSVVYMLIRWAGKVRDKIYTWWTGKTPRTLFQRKMDALRSPNAPKRIATVKARILEEEHNDE